MHKVCAYGPTLNPAMEMGGSPGNGLINLCNSKRKRKIIYRSNGFPIGTHRAIYRGFAPKKDGRIVPKDTDVANQEAK